MTNAGVAGNGVNRAVDTLVFDLDGTLVDSSADITRAVNGVLDERAKGRVTREHVIPLLGEGAASLIHNVLEIVGEPTDRAVVEQCTRRYLELYAAEPVRDSELYPGVAETLAQLAERGIRMGICTNKNEFLAKEVLRQLGVLELFSSVVGGDRLSVRKPHPAHLLASLEELGAGRRTSAFVGDSAIDVACARRAGVLCYVVGWAPPALPDPRLTDFAELVALTAPAPEPTP